MASRSYRRFYFDQSISGRLQIAEHQGRKIQCAKFTTVNILNISQGGMCFCSDLYFPVTEEYMVRITFGREAVTGTIVWREAGRKNYNYGLKSTSASVGFLVINHELKVYNL